MKHQKGLSLISTLLVGLLLIAALVLGFKIVPVYTEYRGITRAFSNVVGSLDPNAPASEYRNAFRKYMTTEYFGEIDSQTITVDKNGGVVTMSLSYRREVPIYKNMGMYFDLNATSQ